MKTQPRTAQSAAAANGNNGTSIRFGAVGVGLCLGALITVASVIWAVAEAKRGGAPLAGRFAIGFCVFPSFSDAFPAPGDDSWPRCAVEASSVPMGPRGR